jgi:hypothetical protein
MSRKYLESKEGSWLDRSSHPYKEDEFPICYYIDGMKRCIDADSSWNLYIQSADEIGKNKEINRLQKTNRCTVLKINNVKSVRSCNKRQRNRGKK